MTALSLRADDLEALHRCATDGSLELLYQPEVDLQTGAIVAMEGLLRWHHGERRHARAARVPRPRRAQRRDRRDRRRGCCARARPRPRRWQRLNGPSRQLFLNVSASQLVAPGFVDEVRAWSTEFALPAGEPRHRGDRGCADDARRPARSRCCWPLRECGVDARRRRLRHLVLHARRARRAAGRRGQARPALRARRRRRPRGRHHRRERHQPGARARPVRRRRGRRVVGRERPADRARLRPRARLPVRVAAARRQGPLAARSRAPAGAAASSSPATPQRRAIPVPRRVRALPPRWVRFVKGHGTENDFVLLPDPDGALRADRRPGTPAVRPPRGHRRRRDPARGADGCRPGRGDAASAEWFMDYRNADGSIAEMCGNGVRVYARYLVDRGPRRAGPLRLATRGGVKEVDVDGDGDVTVDMGPAVVGEPLTSTGMPATFGRHGQPARRRARAVGRGARRARPGAQGPQRRVRRGRRAAPHPDAGARARRRGRRGRAAPVRAPPSVATVLRPACRADAVHVDVPGGRLTVTWRDDGTCCCPDLQCSSRPASSTTTGWRARDTCRDRGGTEEADRFKRIPFCI